MSSFSERYVCYVRSQLQMAVKILWMDQTQDLPQLIMGKHTMQ